MKDNKPKENKQLQKFGRWLETGSWPQHHTTKDAGKRKPWYVRVVKKIGSVIYWLVMDVVLAIKAIIKELM